MTDMTYEEKYYRYLLRTDASEERIAAAARIHEKTRLEAKRKAEKSAS